MSSFRIIYKPRIRRSWDARHGRFFWDCGNEPPAMWGMGECAESRRRWVLASRWVQQRNMRSFWPGFKRQDAAGGSR